MNQDPNQGKVNTDRVKTAKVAKTPASKWEEHNKAALLDMQEAEMTIVQAVKDGMSAIRKLALTQKEWRSPRGRQVRSASRIFYLVDKIFHPEKYQKAKIERPKVSDDAVFDINGQHVGTLKQVTQP